MRKSILLMCFAVLVLCSFAYAEDAFTIAFEAEKDEIFSNETAIFYLTITNNQNVADQFEIHSPDADMMEWMVFTDPISDMSFVTIDANSAKKTKLLMSPRRYKTPIEDLTFNIVSKNTKEARGGKVRVYVKWSGYPIPREYLPSVSVNAVFSSTNINPSEPFSIKLGMENGNPLNLDNMTIYINGHDMFYEQRYSSLAPGPYSQKIEEFVFDIEPKTLPGKRNITIMITRSNRTFYYYNAPVEVIEYSVLDEQVSEVKTFIKRDMTYTYTHKSNIVKNETIKVPTTFFKRFATYTKPWSKVVKEQGIRYLAWELEMEPYEVFEAKVSINYRPAFFAVILLVVCTLAGLFSYYKYRSPVVVRKTSVTKDGETVTEVKVLLYVKNRTPYAVDNVRVLENIPPMVDLVKDSYLGNLVPTKVLKHEKKGALLKWEIPTLEPFEERIISYRIKPKLDIVGGFSLKQTVIKYSDVKGNLLTVRSNRIVVR